MKVNDGQYCLSIDNCYNSCINNICASTSIATSTVETTRTTTSSAFCKNASNPVCCNSMVGNQNATCEFKKKVTYKISSKILSAYT